MVNNSSHPQIKTRMLLVIFKLYGVYLMGMKVRACYRQQFAWRCIANCLVVPLPPVHSKWLSPTSATDQCQGSLHFGTTYGGTSRKLSRQVRQLVSPENPSQTHCPGGPTAGEPNCFDIFDQVPKRCWNLTVSPIAGRRSEPDLT